MKTDRQTIAVFGLHGTEKHRWACSCGDDGEWTTRAEADSEGRRHRMAHIHSARRSARRSSWMFGAMLGFVQGNAVAGTGAAIAFAIAGLWWWVPLFILIGALGLLGWYKLCGFALLPPRNS